MCAPTQLYACSHLKAMRDNMGHKKQWAITAKLKVYDLETFYHSQTEITETITLHFLRKLQYFYIHPQCFNTDQLCDKTPGVRFAKIG